MAGFCECCGEPLGSGTIELVSYVLRDDMLVCNFFIYLLGWPVKEQGKSGTLWQQWRQCSGTVWSLGT
jgi:hypothetical protein